MDVPAASDRPTAPHDRPVSGRPLPRPPRWRQPMLLQRLLSDPRPVLDELRERHGPVVGLGAGPMRLAIIGDPTALASMFALGTEPFRWGHRFNVLGFVVGADSLIVSDGADWKRRRSALRTGFSRRRLNGWVHTIVTETDRRIDAILARTGGRPEVVDLYAEGRQLVQEIVVRTMFGPALAERAGEIAGLLERAQAYLESSFVRQLPHPLPLGRRAEVRADVTELRAIVDARIAELRAAPEHDPLDLLAALVADSDLTDTEIRDQVTTLMGAGMDTTSATLAWMLWCIALAGPDLWARPGGPP